MDTSCIARHFAKLLFPPPQTPVAHSTQLTLTKKQVADKTWF